MKPANDFAAGKELLAAGKAFEALPCLQRAYEQEPDNAAYASYYGLVMALERGQLRQSLDLCREAVDRDPVRPDLYLNLARVHLKAGQKPEAVEALREGLALAPEHEGIRAALKQLGVRRPPLFKSLPRQHPLNKYLGLVAARLHLR